MRQHHIHQLERMAAITLGAYHSMRLETQSLETSSLGHRRLVLVRTISHLPPRPLALNILALSQP